MSQTCERRKQCVQRDRAKSTAQDVSPGTVRHVAVPVDELRLAEGDADNPVLDTSRDELMQRSGYEEQGERWMRQGG